MLTAQGQLDDALEAYRASLAIVERLAAADPSNAAWQRDLSVSQDKVGDVLAAQGRLDDALDAYRASLAICERLAAADPSNAGWQRDLSVSHNKVGDVLTAQGQLDDALEAYRASLAIAERLAAADPSNATWQRDLSVSHQKIGFVAEQRGENDEAPHQLYAFARHPVALGRAGRFQRHLAQRPCLGRRAARSVNRRRLARESSFARGGPCALRHGCTEIPP